MNVGVQYMEFEIIQASQDNAHELSILTGELLREIMDRINMKAFNFEQQETEARAKEMLSEKVYYAFLARERNTDEAIGFISLYESYALYSEGAYGTIPELYVRPEYRSGSIGASLLKRAKEFAVSKNWKRLEVTTPPIPEFDRTLSFYESNGFEISGGKKLKTDIQV